MNLEQYSRLRAMCDCLPGSVASWDLSREDQNAIRAAIHGLPNPRLVQALQAILLFYVPGPWDSARQLEWGQLTDHADCTTKGLCDFIRKRLAEPFSEDISRVVQGIVRDVAGAKT
jgi:hypothetical protein